MSDTPNIEPTNEPQKRGRKPWVPTEKDFQDIAFYGSLMLDDRQIAAILGISHTTFYEKLKEYPELSDAIERGRALTTSRVAARVIQEAQNKEGDFRAAQLFLTTKGRWRQDFQVEHSGTIGIETLREDLEEKTKAREAQREADPSLACVVPDSNLNDSTDSDETDDQSTDSGHR